MRLYDARKNAFQHKYEHKAAVMDCCFSDDDTKAFSGGVDRNLVMCVRSALCSNSVRVAETPHAIGRCDFKTGRSTVLGSHDNTIRCVNFSAATNSVFTGGWDCKVRFRTC